MSEFENTMELSINPYDDLTEAAEPAVSPVILKNPGSKESVKPAEKTMEIIPLASDITNITVSTKGYTECEEMTLDIEDDLLVPDTEADMESVLNMTASAESIKIYDKDDGGCEVRGTVKLETMYRSAGVYNNVLSFITAELPFKKNCGDKFQMDNDAVVAAEIKKIEHHVINERKYRVKLSVLLTLKTIKVSEQKFFEGIEGTPLYLKKEKIKFADLLSHKAKDSEVREELLINNEKIRPVKILKSKFSISENYRKLTKEKLIVNFSIWVRIIYMAELASKGNLSGQPMLFVGKIDHTQFIPLGKHESGADACIVTSNEKTLRAEINDAVTGFKIEGDISTEIDFYKFTEKELVTDFYHGSEEMTCDKKEENTCCYIDNIYLEHTIRENIRLQGSGSDDQRLIYLDGNYAGVHAEVSGGHVAVKGRVRLEAVTMNEGDYTVLAKKMCDFTCTADVAQGAVGPAENTAFRIEAGIPVIREMSADTAGGDQVSITAQLQIPVTVFQERSFGIISNPCIIRSGDSSKTYPLTIYTVKENETSWDIAKRFKVPEENITENNKAEDIYPGRKIVIMK